MTECSKHRQGVACIVVLVAGVAFTAAYAFAVTVERAELAYFDGFRAAAAGVRCAQP